MAQIVVDAMNTAASWSALAPDGVTASTELSMADDTTRFRYGADRTSARITGSTAARNHTLRRTLPGVDLSAYDDLRLWIYSDRVADGSDARPFFLELRLGSAAMGLADPANRWQRYLPVSGAATWESVRLDLRDVDPSVRSAVAAVQIRCADASSSFVCYIDDLLAVRDQMLGDVEAALVARLDRRIVSGATRIAAVVAVAGAPAAATQPFILITHYDVRFSDARTSSARVSTDFSNGGYQIRPPAYAYDLVYQIEAWADDRATQTQILEFVLSELTPRGELVVGGLPLPIDGGILLPALEVIGGHRTSRVPLFYRISARQEVGAPQPVRAVKAVVVNVDSS